MGTIYFIISLLIFAIVILVFELMSGCSHHKVSNALYAVKREAQELSRIVSKNGILKKPNGVLKDK